MSSLPIFQTFTLKMAHILIIEDDPRLGPRLKRNLELSGYRVSLARNGRSGLNSAMTGSAHLIVLDLMLPLIDGLHILKKIRREQVNIPVIILTAKGRETERLEGFRAGCDDYVTKPFSLMELIARIRAVLRRSGYQEKFSVINSAGVMIDPEARSVTLKGCKIEFSPREFELLYTLTSHPNQALSRNYLLNAVWGEDNDVMYRTVDSHISYLRHKIESNPEAPVRIVTVYKVGYKWCTTG
ncbi:response regulator transcription factor [bacterium]|nr:response regulator transcription factor [bacterium]